jgi:hypothetical protein
MPTLGGDPGRQEKQRLCPSCRMSISALATRCHYCGEEVARPKVEDRKLTINDLGGPAQNTFQISHSVLNALEAFRVEEGVSATATPEPKKKSRFGKKEASAGPSPQAVAAQTKAQSTMLLDELGLAPRPVSTSGSRRDPAWVTKIGVLGGFIAGILILFFGGVKGFAMISDYLEQRKNQDVLIVENRALQILEQKGDVVAALEAAMKSLRANPTPENEDIAAQVRRLVVREIETKLTVADWKQQDLRDASRIAHQAASIEPNDLLNKYLRLVEEETSVYFSSLRAVDVENATATFRRGTQETVVREGQPFWGRFILAKVQRDGVVVEDDMRKDSRNNNRRLWYGIDGQVRLQK